MVYVDTTLTHPPMIHSTDGYLFLSLTFLNHRYPLVFRLERPLDGRPHTYKTKIVKTSWILCQP